MLVGVGELVVSVDANVLRIELVVGTDCDWRLGVD